MLLVCALIQDEILHEFWLWKFFTVDFLEFVGDGIGMPV